MNIFYIASGPYSIMFMYFLGGHPLHTFIKASPVAIIIRNWTLIKVMIVMLRYSECEFSSSFYVVGGYTVYRVRSI